MAFGEQGYGLIGLIVVEVLPYPIIRFQWVFHGISRA